MRILSILIFFFLTGPFNLWANSLFLINIGHAAIELELADLTYMPLSLYLPLTGEDIPTIAPKSEVDIYKHLFTHAPRFMVLEGSTYPLPLAGIAIKKYAPDFYYQAQYKEFNIIQSATSSLFEEPWAASFFFGNVVFFKPFEEKKYIFNYSFTNITKEQPQPLKKQTEETKITGKGYAGLLLSYGNMHIKNNSIIEDQWIESELKLIGMNSSSIFYLNWSYRIGYRYHFHPDIKNYIYMGIKRDRIDFRELAFWSLIRNSLFEIKLSYDLEEQAFRKFMFLIGKKFPFSNGKYVPELTIGFIWKITSTYSGDLAIDDLPEWQLIVSPNFRF